MKTVKTATFNLRVMLSGVLEDRFVEIRYFEADLSQHPVIKNLGAENDEAVKYLVLYDQSTGDITVDSRAPKDYKDLAALHEAICQGHQHEDWAGLADTDKEERCSCIEDMIFEECSIMFTRNQLEYFKGRLAMYDFLIKHNLNPEMKKSFELSRKEVLNSIKCIEPCKETI